jgi:tetratricopeptide (TPR) repeat protein
LRVHGSLPRLLGWGGLALVLAMGASSAEARTHRRDKKPGDAAAPAAADAGKPAAKDPAQEPSKDPAPASAGTADAAGKPAAPAPATAPAPAGKPGPAPAATAKPGTATATPAGKPAPATPEPAKPASAEAATATPKELQVSEPRQQAAREHFMRGVDLYSQANYPNAWLEFSAAYQIVPLIDLLNNMARCEVRMGRPRDALDHFKRFIAARPNDQDAEYINQEIARLEGELGRRASSGPAPDQTEAPTSKPPPHASSVSSTGAPRRARPSGRQASPEPASAKASTRATSQPAARSTAAHWTAPRSEKYG